MKFFEAMKVSLRSIRSNKLRSFLTMLGIMIGVGAVIAMVAIGEGSKAKVAAEINGLGSNLLIVTPDYVNDFSAKLTLEDAEALKKNPSITAVTPSVQSRVRLVHNSDSYETSLEGSSDEYLTVRNVNVQQGRFFTEIELKSGANVIVIGPEVVRNLFASTDDSPLGKTIVINGVPFYVIGILEGQGNSGMTNNDDKVIVPISTAMERLGQRRISTIYVSAASADQMDQAQLDITTTLRAHHKLNPASENDFRINSQSDILKTEQRVTSTMTTLLSGIAAISLVVGGIGIMNIMLVSVTERTREIGIRKAIGATKAAILKQFLIESIALSLLGGVIGIIAGVGAALIAKQVGGVDIAITASPILYAFLSSLAVGVMFGVYPAKKAAEMKPIDALRYE